MGHDHSHHSHHAHSDHRTQLGGHKKGLWGVLILSSTYMVAEIIGGLMSGSLALLADAGHMAIDVASIALSLFAVWIATKPADPEKTYGYYRAEILAALLNGATLVAISIWICYEAWVRFHETQVIRGELMTGIAFGGLVVNFIGLYLLKGHSSHNLNARGVWLHLLTDTLGSLAAMAAGFVIWKFGWNLADPIISVVIALFILYGSWHLLKECVDVLLEGVPKGMSVQDIKYAIESVPQVKEVHDLHVWTVTSGVPSLSAHVGIKAEADPSVVLRLVTELLEKKFKIDHVTIQVEPATFTHVGEHCKLGHP